MKGKFLILVALLVLGGFATEQKAEAYVGFHFGISAHYPVRGYYHGGYYPRYYGWYRPYYRPYFYGYYWGPYSYYSPYYYPAPAYYSPYGEIRTEVKPKEASIYVDGDYVGFVDQYDGWWQRLNLEPGRHRLVFRAPGFVPYVIDVRVLPGQDQHIKYQMQPGKDYIAENELRPEDNGRRPFPRQKEGYGEPPPGLEREQPQEPSRSPEPYTPDERSEQVRFRLSVIPPDATVYIDGNFYGMADSGREVQVLLPEGTHRVEIVRPGFRSFAQDVVVSPENDRIEVQLEKK